MSCTIICESLCMCVCALLPPPTHKKRAWSMLVPGPLRESDVGHGRTEKLVRRRHSASGSCTTTHVYLSWPVSGWHVLRRMVTTPVSSLCCMGYTSTRSPGRPQGHAPSSCTRTGPDGGVHGVGPVSACTSTSLAGGGRGLVTSTTSLTAPVMDR